VERQDAQVPYLRSRTEHHRKLPQGQRHVLLPTHEFPTPTLEAAPWSQRNARRKNLWMQSPFVPPHFEGATETVHSRARLRATEISRSADGDDIHVCGVMKNLRPWIARRNGVEPPPPA